jgi:hypothetical protein
MYLLITELMRVFETFLSSIIDFLKIYFPHFFNDERS